MSKLYAAILIFCLLAISVFGQTKISGTAKVGGTVQMGSGSAAQTPTFVRGNYVQGTSTTTITLPSNTAGHLLVVVGGTFTGTISSVTDTAGNTYTGVGTLTTDGSGTFAQIFYVASCLTSAGTNTITLNGNGATYSRIAVAEYSGVAATSPLRTHAEATGSSTAADTGNMTVVVGDLVIGWMVHQTGNANFTTDGSYTYREGSGNGSGNEGYIDKLAASTTEHPNGTASPSTNWLAVGAAFKPGP